MVGALINITLQELRDDAIALLLRLSLQGSHYKISASASPPFGEGFAYLWKNPKVKDFTSGSLWAKGCKLNLLTYFPLSHTTLRTTN
jgi:hypothetical protein